MDDPDAAVAGERDREPRLGDRVHRRRDDRDLERDRPRQARRRAHVVRQHGRLGGQEQDVVEGEAFAAELRPRTRAPAPPRRTGYTAAPDERSSRPRPSSTSSTPPASRPTSRGSKRPAPTSSVDAAPAATASRSASSADLPGELRGDELREQDVAGADDRDRLDARRERLVAPDLPVLPEQRVAARLERDVHVAGAELARSCRAPSGSPPRPRAPARRRARPRAGSGRRETAPPRCRAGAAAPSESSTIRHAARPRSRTASA